jgi:hypothetical protein
MAIFHIEGIDAAELALLLSAIALLLSLFLGSSGRRAAARRPVTSPAEGRSAPAGGSPDGELVAVIAAAVAAASGMAPGSFRVAGIREIGTSGGFSTPVWGHVDRISRTGFTS